MCEFSKSVNGWCKKILIEKTVHKKMDKIITEPSKKTKSLKDKNKSNRVPTIDAFSRIVLVLVFESSFNGIISNS